MRMLSGARGHGELALEFALRRQRAAKQLEVEVADAARDALKRQFAGAVLWLPTVHGMLESGVRNFVECGPKPTLVNMVKRIATGAGVDGVETAAATTAGSLTDPPSVSISSTASVKPVMLSASPLAVSHGAISE